MTQAVIVVTGTLVLMMLIATILLLLLGKILNRHSYESNDDDLGALFDDQNPETEGAGEEQPGLPEEDVQAQTESEPQPKQHYPAEPFDWEKTGL